MKTEVIIQKRAEKDIRLYVDGVRYDAVSCMVCAVPELHVSYYWKNPTVDEKIYCRIDCDSVRFVDESGNIKEARDGMYDFPLYNASGKPVEATKEVKPTVDTSEPVKSPRKTVSVHDMPMGLSVSVSIDNVTVAEYFRIAHIEKTDNGIMLYDDKNEWVGFIYHIDSLEADTLVHSPCRVTTE